MQIEVIDAIFQANQGKTRQSGNFVKWLWQFIYFQLLKFFRMFDKTIVMPEFGDKCLKFSNGSTQNITGKL